MRRGGHLLSTLSAALLTFAGTVLAGVAPVACDQGTNCAVLSQRYGVSLSYTDSDGGDMAFTLLGGPSLGTLECWTNGLGWQSVTAGVPVGASTWYYSTTETNVGLDGFTWQVSDGTATSSPAIVSLALTANTAPVAGSQSLSMAVGAVRYDISLSCTHPDLYQPMTYRLLTPPGRGTLEYYADTNYCAVVTNAPIASGWWVYTPSGTNTGADSFSWQADNGMTTSGIATVNISLAGNSAPRSFSQSQSAVLGTTRSVIYLSYSHSDSYQPVGYQLLTAPGKGTLECASGTNYLAMATNTSTAESQWYYTPTVTNAGTDTFTWQMSDGLSTSGVATVTLSLTTNSVPVANSQTQAVAVGSVRYYLYGSYSHADSGQPMTFQLTTAPAKGKLEYQWSGTNYLVFTTTNPITQQTWYYTPAGTNTGTDTFGWRVSDGISTSSVATYTINLTTNSPPVATSQTNTIPIGAFRYYLYLPNSHPDSYQPMAYQLVAPPGSGTLEYRPSGTNYLAMSTNNPVAQGYWYYTPSGTSTGMDNFVWRMNDGTATSGVATMTLRIVTNSPPAANAQSLSMLKNTVRNSISLSYSHSDSYQPTTFRMTVPPAHGAVECWGSPNYITVTTNDPVTSTSWYYTPTTGYTGADSLKWTISDGVSTSTAATYTFTVTSNRPPVVANIRATCRPSGSVSLAASYQDADSGQTWTAAVVSNAANGNVTVNGTSLTYTPNSGFKGLDRFTYKVNDTVDDSNVGGGLVQVRDSGDRASNLVVLVVNNLLLPVLSNEVYRLKADLEHEGYTSKVKSWTLGTSAVSNLWSYLVSEYTNTSQFLAGTILIGDLPKPQVNNTVDSTYGGWVYTDLVYWNLEYYQTLQTYTPPRSIWASRIISPGTTYGSEATLLRRALDANHEYRTGVSRLPYKAFYFMIPGWWGSYGDSNNVVRLRDVWPDGEGRAQDTSHAAFLPNRADLHVGRNYAGADCLAAGGEVFDETSHGNTSGFMSQAGSADFSTGWVVMDMLYRVIDQIRFTLDGSCDNGAYGAPANHMITTRGGGAVLAVGGSAINWAGDFVISENTTADNGFRQLIKAGESMGTAGVQFYAYDSLYNDRTIFFGDLSLGVMAAPSNALPVIRGLAVSTPSTHAPFSANLRVDVYDPDGTVSNVEWFSTGYDCGRASPAVSGFATNASWSYATAGVYEVRVEAMDNYKARAWLETNLTVNTPPTANSDAASVIAGRSVTVNVLTNDVDDDGHAITLQSCTKPPHATATVNGSSIVCTSTNSWQGTESFTYTIADTLGGVGTGRVDLTVCFDTVRPAITAVSCAASNLVRITYSKPLDPVTSQTPANYAIDRGVAVQAAVLGVDSRTVTLRTSWLAEGVVYTLTVNGVKDDVPFTPNTILPNSQRTFVCHAPRGNRLRLAFDGYDRSETLTNFPVLVVLSDGLGGFRYNQMAGANGRGLRFFAADETLELPYEIEQWNTNGSSYAWVRVPALSAGTSIWAKWGDDTQTNQPAYTTDGTTWLPGYLGVWHMNQTNAQDSTANRFNGTAQGTVSQVVAGASGPANSVRGSAGYIAVPDNSAFTMTGSYTVGTWVWTSNTNGSQGLLGTYNGSGFILGLNGGPVQFWDGGWRANNFLLGAGMWNQVVYTRSGTTNRFFMNGVNVTTATTGASTGNGIDLWLGAAHWNDGFNGLIDETRIASVARSTNWVWAEWLNVASNAAFCQYGTMETMGSGSADTNGVPDAWKLFYFGSTSNADADALADPDHDGLNNRQERLAGTDPTNSASGLRFGSPDSGGSGLDMDFQTVPDFLYDVYWKSNLISVADWQFYTSFIASGSVSHVLFTNRFDQGFFRFSVEQP